MKRKIKIYRMPLSKTFPATHPRAGNKTYFEESIKRGVGCPDCTKVRNPTSCYYCGKAGKKIHTIRANHALWKTRIDEVTAGRAVLVLCEWNGKPYSKDGSRGMFIFGTGAVKDFIYDLKGNEKYMYAIPVIDSGIGMQELYASMEDDLFNRVRKLYEGDANIAIPFERLEIAPIKELAKNDGLSLDDFKAWFKGYDLSKPMSIIHFTTFRYGNN
jgi:hypothetical protein